MKRFIRFPGLLISLAVAAASIFLYSQKPFVLEKLELAIQDCLFRLRGPLQGDARITLVAIDKKSIQDAGKWPWPRARLAELIQRISSASPALIVLDLLFAEESPEEVGGDRLLAEAMERAGTTVIPFLFFTTREEARHQTQETIEDGLALVRSAEFNQVKETGPPVLRRCVYEACGIEAPARLFARASTASGFYNIIPEPDGSWRAVPLVIYAQERPYGSLAVSVVREFLRSRDSTVVLRGDMVEQVTVGPTVTETDQCGCMVINFYGPPSVFTTVSAGDVLTGSPDAAAALRGKIVFVGGTSLGDFESRAVPLSPVAYSVQIQANAVDNILNGTYLRDNYLSVLFSLAAMLGPALLLGILLPRQRRASVGLLAVPCIVVGLVAGDYFLLTAALVRASVVYGMLSTVASYLFVSLHRFASRERGGRRLADAVNEMTRTITSILDLDEILPRILACLTDFVHADRGALLLYEQDGAEGATKLVVKATVRMDADVMEAEGFSASKKLIARAAEQQESILVTTARWRRALGGEATRCPGAVLCLPLTQRNRLLGIIYAEMAERPGVLLERHMPIINSFAAQAAVALENARLHTFLLKREERLKSQYLQLKDEVERGQRFPFIIGTSAAMQRLYDLLQKAIDASITVLILGETGTGKEVIARTIHYMGQRKGRAFVAQNCASLPEALLESELFGHKRGAFTGAVSDKKGLFEIADGGTVFLDEIGEMSLGTQAKILRVLEGGIIRPLGDTRERKVDVRIISATNRDLADEMRKQKFREDLFYRLNVFPISVPPLRERREDIPLLANHFLSLSSRKLERPVKGFSAEAMDLLVAYDYPGNVRELENEIERLVVLVPEGELITADLLSPKFKGARTPGVQEYYVEQAVNLNSFIRSAERSYIRDVLRQCNGSKTLAAQRLGISRVTLHKKLREYELM
jgi:transcriptional regulator with GAF, ATPase, and Fis domain/CHASE2 domain-containing sensor protein